MGALELDQPKPLVTLAIYIILFFMGVFSIIVFPLMIITALFYIPVDPEFHIESATVSQLSHDGGPELTSTWNLTLVSTNPNSMHDIYLTGLEVSLSSWGQLGIYTFQLVATKQLPPPPDVIKMKNNNRVGVNISFESFDSDELGKLISQGSARLGLNVSASYNYYKIRMLVKKIVQGGKPLLWKGFCYPLRFGAGKGDQPTPCHGATLD